MNKNPERPDDIDEIVSECFNPNYKKKLSKMEKYHKVQKEIEREIFGNN